MNIGIHNNIKIIVCHDANSVSILHNFGKIMSSRLGFPTYLCCFYIF